MSSRTALLSGLHATPPAPAGTRRSRRFVGLSPGKDQSKLLQSAMGKLVSPQQNCCSAFGPDRRVKYPDYVFCGNCDDWEEAFYSGSGGRIDRNSRRFRCECDHQPTSLFPTQRKVIASPSTEETNDRKRPAEGKEKIIE